MKRKLYPRSDESMSTLCVKTQDSILDIIDDIKRAEVRTKSEVTRTLLVEALRARGLIASADEMAEAAA